MLLHRGVGDYDGRDWQGNRHATAEDWWDEMKTDRPDDGFGRWWDADPKVADFYGGSENGTGGTGSVVSARFPRSAVKDTGSTGVLVDPGTPGKVHRVVGNDENGSFVLPHRPGFKIHA